MQYFILIYTDNNRNKLIISMIDEFSNSIPLKDSHHSLRLIYQEIYESADAARARLGELQAYTRMQKERIIRRNNPNWVDLLRPSLPNTYQPGVKFSPNVPNFISVR